MSALQGFARSKWADPSRQLDASDEKPDRTVPAVTPSYTSTSAAKALTRRRNKSQARTVGIASIIWAASIFLSRIMGLVREQIIGRTLGASREADLYFASFTLPDFLNYLAAAGALSIVFIPIFVEYLERGDREGGWKALSVIANFILLTGSLGIALLMVFARPLVDVVAPGFTGPGEVDTLVRLIRIILPTHWAFCTRKGKVFRRTTSLRSPGDRGHTGAEAKVHQAERSHRKPNEGQESSGLEWSVVLGTKSEASYEEAQRVYRLKMKHYHPDTFAGLGPEFLKLAEPRSKELNAAIEEARRCRRSSDRE